MRRFPAPHGTAPRALLRALRRACLCSLLLALLLPLFAGCDALTPACTVTYYVDGEVYASVTAPLGSPLPPVAAPEKDSHLFLGWYNDPEATVSATLLSTVSKDLALHASFAPDGIALTNRITRERLCSIVTVYHVTNTGNSWQKSRAQGSGVIFEISSGFCYLLTNCHVAETAEGVKHDSYEIVDAFGKTHKGFLYRNPNKDVPALSKKHDLAVLYFPMPEEEINLAPIPFGEDPAVGDTVITLGTPKGQRNAIAFGEVLRYKRIAVTGQDDTNCITFEAIEQNAFTAGGSSGGALLGTDLSLVGIHYAGHTETAETYERHYGYSVPISRVREFLSVYVYGG